MKWLTDFVALFPLIVTINGSSYYIDSSSECFSFPTTHQIYDWDSAYIYGGKHTWQTISLFQTCKIKLQAEDSDDRLKVEVQSFKFDGDSLASLKVYDSSNAQYTSDLKYTINHYTYLTPSTFTSSSEYVYIILDRGCLSSKCSDKYKFTLKVTAVDSPDSDDLSVGGIIAIVFGAVTALVLLTTVPICCCYCCAAASNSVYRRTTGQAVITTSNTTGYLTQQYNGGVSSPVYSGTDNNQYTCNQPTEQHYQSTASAPPSYETVTTNKDQPQGYSSVPPTGAPSYLYQQPPPYSKHH